MSWNEGQEFDERFEDSFDFSTVKDLMKGKLKERLLYLEEREKNLSERYSNTTSELRKANEKIRVLENGKEAYEKKLREETIQSLLSEFNKTFWYVKREHVQDPKCSKCDKDRRVEYKSADGLTMLGQCTCNKYINTYSVEKARATSIKVFDHEFLLYLAREDEDNEDEYTYYSDSPNRSYNNGCFDPPKEEWKDWYYSNVVFSSKENAEEYAALRNKKKE